MKKYILSFTLVFIFIFIVEVTKSVDVEYLLYNSKNFQALPEYKNELDTAVYNFTKKRKLFYNSDNRRGISNLKKVFSDYSLINSKKIKDIENEKLKVILEVRQTKKLFYKEYSISIVEIKDERIELIGEYRIIKEAFQATNELIKSYNANGY